MRHARILGFALFAALALNVIVAVGSASAALPEMLPGAGVTFTNKASEALLVTLIGEEVLCKKVTSKGEITSPKLGKVTFVFEGCTEHKGGTTCTGLSDKTAGNITVEGEFHFWYGFLGAEKIPALVVLPKHTHFSCAGGLVLVLVLGCVAGWVLETNKLVKVFDVHFQQSTPGDPHIPTVLNENNEQIKCELLTSFNEGAEESSAEVVLGEVEGFKKGVENITVLMDA